MSDDRGPESAERELALVDRIIGLEAELAELHIALERAQAAREDDETAAVRAELARVYASSPWRVGRLLTAPARVLKRRLRAMGR